MHRHTPGPGSYLLIAKSFILMSTKISPYCQYIYINVYGFEKRGTSSFFVLLRFLVSVDSAIPEHYDDAKHFSVRCFLIELCGKLAVIPVYRESENERS